MPDISKILSTHQQLYQNSCSASGMELILKFHGKIPEDWFDYQHEFKDTNIGFTKLQRLTSHGISTIEANLNKSDFIAKMTEETQAGRFPLVSLPNGAYIDYHSGNRIMGCGWHIWAAVPEGTSFKLSARNFGNSVPIHVDQLSDVLDRILDFEPKYLVHCATYTTT